MKKPKIVSIIPSRFGSVRFPGKPLALIAGKTLLQRTYENALKCKKFDLVMIATDHEAIFKHAKEMGAHVVMTSPNCATGTDRLEEVLRTDPLLSDAEIIVNVQGDEPCIDPTVIDKAIEALQNSPEAVMATAITPLKNKDQALNSSVVKCVKDENDYALYFSRSLIPGGKMGYLPENTYYRHIGLYVYRRDFLLKYSKLSPTPLQLAEDLEQLKVLEHGYRMKVVIVNEDGIGVDTPEDIQKIEQLLCKQNTSS